MADPFTAPPPVRGRPLLYRRAGILYRVTPSGGTAAALHKPGKRPRFLRTAWSSFPRDVRAEITVIAARRDPQQEGKPMEELIRLAEAEVAATRRLTREIRRDIDRLVTTYGEPK